MSRQAPIIRQAVTPVSMGDSSPFTAAMEASSIIANPSKVDPADLAKNGVRPNNRNSVFFKPGPGKVIEEFDHGTVTIALDYFLEEQQETTSNRVTWTIRVD